MVTVLAIVFTDLLIGIGIGLSVALSIFILRRTHASPCPADRRRSTSTGRSLHVQLPEQVTFLAKANIERTLQALPVDSRVEIDGRQTTRLDPDVLEQLHEFADTARLRRIDYRLVGIPAAPTSNHKL